MWNCITWAVRTAWTGPYYLDCQNSFYRFSCCLMTSTCTFYHSHVNSKNCKYMSNIHQCKLRDLIISKQNTKQSISQHSRLISCQCKGKIDILFFYKFTKQPSLPVSQHSTATLITPSLLFSNNSYASLILFNGYVCVISGSVLILPSDISFRVSSQSQPSTPPVLKVRFLPYISGSGNICALS